MVRRRDFEWPGRGPRSAQDKRSSRADGEGSLGGDPAVAASWPVEGVGALVVSATGGASSPSGSIAPQVGPLTCLTEVRLRVVAQMTTQVVKADGVSANLGS